MRNQVSARTYKLALLIVLALCTIAGVAYAQESSFSSLDNISATNLPPDKATFLAMVDATQEAAVATHPTAIPNPSIDIPTAKPEAPYETRIDNVDGPVPFSSDHYRFVNVFVSQIQSYDYEVFAGTSFFADDAPRGAVVVLIGRSDWSLPSLGGGESLAPAGVTQLELKSFSGPALSPTLTVAEVGGTRQFTFEVVKQVLTESTKLVVAPQN